MRMDDAVHLGPHSIDPDVEPHSGVWNALAFYDFHFTIHPHQIAGRGPRKAGCKVGRPVRAGCLGPSRDLPCQIPCVPLICQQPTGERHILQPSEGRRAERGVHLPIEAFADLLASPKEESRILALSHERSTKVRSMNRAYTT